MNKLLGNLNDIENGEYTSTAKPESNEMKKILESFNTVTESETAVEECGTMPMQQSMPQEQGTPVTMNVNLSASGKDHVDDLMALMKAAGLDHAGPVRSEPEPSQDMDMAKMRMLMSPEMMDDDVDEEWDNAPDEEYKDDDYMIKDLSGGLNRQKKSYAAAQDGDNAMAVETIKDRLLAALNEKKAKPDYIDIDGDGDTEEPMKKAAKDKKKKK